MVKDHLTDRLGMEPMLSVKWQNNKLDSDGQGNGNGMCKQAFTREQVLSYIRYRSKEYKMNEWKFPYCFF